MGAVGTFVTLFVFLRDGFRPSFSVFEPWIFDFSSSVSHCLRRYIIQKNLNVCRFSLDQLRQWENRQIHFLLEEFFGGLHWR